MTEISKDDLDRYAREATDREMERRLRRLHRQDRPADERDTGTPKGIYFPPHIERRRRLFYAELAQAGVISGWGVATGSHAPPDMAPGRDGQLLDMSHFVPTPADPERPNGPRVWARLDTRHPIDSMYRRGSLAPDKDVAICRYRAAQVWERYFNRANGIGGGPGFMSESVDGSGDPQAAMHARMEATMERLNVMDAPGMTERRFRDLDSVVGYGKTPTQVANGTGRTANAVKKSIFAGLDAVAGFARWDRLMQGVQIVAAYKHRDERRKNFRKTG
jgi:hypothetical protein